MLIRRVFRVFALFCGSFCVGQPVGAQTLVDGASPAVLLEQVRLPNPQSNSFGFGASVAISGDTLIVGAPYIAPAGTQRGQASIYTRVGGTWVLQQTLTRSVGLGFGGSVAVSGDTVLVGNRRYAGITVRSAQVFVRTGATWTLQADLTPGDGVAHVGESVALDGNTALVADATGTVYAFVRTGGVWTQQAKFPTAAPGGFSEVGARIIALDGDTALIGMPRAPVPAALVFVRAGNVWTQQATLTPKNGQVGFGTVVALKGDTALIGPRRGYLFTRVGGTWVEQAPLEAPDVVSSPTTSVAFDGTTAILGHPFQGTSDAYAFRRVGGQWTFLDRLIPSDGHLDDGFGLSVSVSGDTVLVGAPDFEAGEETNGPGRAYLFNLPNNAPEAPVLSGSASGTTLTLSWTPSSTGPPATSYVVEAGTSTGASNLFNGNVGGALQVSGTVAPGTYLVRVRGVNALGTSPPSNEVVLTVGSSVPLPGPPTLNGSVNQTTVSLTWTPSSTGGAPTSYVVEAGTAPGASNLFVGNVGGGTQLSATIGAGVYYVRVRGVNTAGTGPVSNEVALTVGGCGPPSPPTGLTFTASANLVTISWNASAGASEYFLQAGTAPGLSNLFNGTVGNATAISGTVGAGTYYVRLMAANSCGTSAPSSELVLTVP